MASEESKGVENSAPEPQKTTPAPLAPSASTAGTTTTTTTSTPSSAIKPQTQHLVIKTRVFY